jgi:hypothetical protein
VDLPWSMWATMEKLRMWERLVVMGAGFSTERGRSEPAGRRAVFLGPEPYA